jgi:hypothetical protein
MVAVAKLTIWNHLYCILDIRLPLRIKIQAVDSINWLIWTYLIQIDK